MQTIIRLARGLILPICLMAGAEVVAEELDGRATEALALQGVWAAEEDSYGYWSWNDDGTVCMRLRPEDSECTDAGSWAMDGDTLCYELEWWGEAYGQRAACVKIVAHDDAPYEVLYQGETLVSTMFHFTVVAAQ